MLAESGVELELAFGSDNRSPLIRFWLRSSAQPDGVGDEHECGETMHALRAMVWVQVV